MRTVENKNFLLLFNLCIMNALAIECIFVIKYFMKNVHKYLESKKKVLTLQRI